MKRQVMRLGLVVVALVIAACGADSRDGEPAPAVDDATSADMTVVTGATTTVVTIPATTTTVTTTRAFSRSTVMSCDSTRAWM